VGEGVGFAKIRRRDALSEELTVLTRRSEPLPSGVVPETLRAEQ
jgi:hypothetical protein